eukprot:7351519-Lingulodinium_polyedra.AAC.1
MESATADASSRGRQPGPAMGSTTVDASAAPTPPKADVAEALKTSRAYEKLTIPPLPNVAQLDVWMLS